MSHPPFIAVDAAHSNWQTAVDDCLAQLLDTLQRQGHTPAAHPYTLGWLYLTDYLAPDAEQILQRVRERLPGIAWTGATGIGIAVNGVEYIDTPALAVMLAPLSRESFRLFSGRRPLDPDEAGFKPHTAQVHADGNAPELQELLKELAERVHTGYLFGGLPSSRNETLQIADEVFSGGLSGVAFDDSVDVISRVTQGSQPVGPMRMITRADDNLVITLEHEPALDCALNDLGLPQDMDTETMAQTFASTLIGLRIPGDDRSSPPRRFGPDTMVRHIVGIDPANRMLAVAEEVQAGMNMAFCRRDASAAMADLIDIATEIRDEAALSDRQISGAVYISCAGRGGRHFGAPHAELRAIRNVLGDLPLVGFFAGGEIARERLYGYTGVLTVFTSPLQ